MAARPRNSGVAGPLAIAGWVTALGVAIWRFATVDLRLAEVAAHTRHEVPWPLRIAGVWAGPSGSLLFWFVIVIGGLVLATRSTVRTDVDPQHVRLLGTINAVAALTLLLLSRPFRRLDEPALAGAGLNPVLEHPLMTIHPPLLYLSHAAVLGAALVGMNAGPHADEAGGRRSTHRWTAGATALLVVATLLGSWWAHDELGWGGWWAWDPVENTALAPMVCLFAALHSRTRQVAQRWRLGAAALVLAGIAMTRSGLPISVHAFAPSGWVAVVFAAGTGLVLFHLARSWRITQDTPASSDQTESERETEAQVGAETEAEAAATGRQPRRRWAPAAIAEVVTGSAAAWIVVVVVSAGIAASWLGTRDPAGAVDGRLLGPITAPVGVVALCALVVAGFRRRHRAAALLAHVGVVIFAVGVVGSLASTSHRGAVDVGSTTRLGGYEVAIVGARVVTERPDLVALRIDATIDGRPVVVSILDHPDLNRTRARPGRLIDLGGETELVVSLLADDRARVELRRHPGLPHLWLGGALCAAGLTVSAASGGRQPSLRRRRLASSNESSGEAPSTPSPAP